MDAPEALAEQGETSYSGLSGAACWTGTTAPAEDAPPAFLSYGLMALSSFPYVD